jgi:hypothetical protein
MNIEDEDLEKLVEISQDTNYQESDRLSASLKLNYVFHSVIVQLQDFLLDNGFTFEEFEEFVDNNSDEDDEVTFH